jgi:hypothetical protein
MSTVVSLRTLVLKITYTVLSLALLFGAQGCANYSSSTMASSPNPVAAAGSVTQFRIGDGPADRVTSFEVNIGPMTLMPSSGSPISVLSAPQRVELSHLSATTIPVAVVNVPAGSYSAVSLTLSNPEITFINSLGQIMKIEPAVNQTIAVNFNPILTLNASLVISLDLNLENALTFDAQGNVTGVNLTATAFTVAIQPVGADENNQQEDNGKIEDVTGTVTSVTGNSFTMTLGTTGISLTFSTDSNTEFKDGATLTSLTNMIVKVEGLTRADGTLYAKEVEGAANDSGMLAEGLITNVSGTPATQINLLTQNGDGSGMDDSKIGTPLTVDVSNAEYDVAIETIDTSTLGVLPSPPNFPFDSTTIHAGQRVEVDSDSAIGEDSAKAKRARLEPQGLRGTVSGLPSPTSSGPAMFTLTIPSDSAFAMTSGQAKVQVLWQAGTDLRNLNSVSNGQTVEVRGLVFFTGNAFNMVARRIEQ